MHVHEDFTGPISDRWQQHIKGQGKLELSGDTLRLVNVDTSSQRYSNAQIDDYQGLRRRDFLWNPPLKLSVRARFSHAAGNGAPGLRGTAGFGFWNDPFLMTGARLPNLPRAIWFFHASPPSDMKLDMRTPGYGWKAATIDALRPTALLLAPFAPLATPLMNVRAIYQMLWPPIQRAMRIRETAIEAEMTEWHTYVIDWGTHLASFSVDGQAVLNSAPSPQGPLGFVMWVDNQYMIVKPWGRFGWGTLEAPARQWMEVDCLTIQQPTRPEPS
jgi:hypothetical protein